MKVRCDAAIHISPVLGGEAVLPGGPVFTCFVFNASEPANPFLSAETENKNPGALIIPNTQLQLSPSLIPTWSPNTTETFPSPRRLGGLGELPIAARITDPLCFLLPHGGGWLSARVGGARSSLQRMLRGLLLHSPRCDSKPAQKEHSCVSAFQAPGRVTASNFRLWLLTVPLSLPDVFFAMASAQDSCHCAEVERDVASCGRLSWPSHGTLRPGTQWE